MLAKMRVGVAKCVAAITNNVSTSPGSVLSVIRWLRET